MKIKRRVHLVYGKFNKESDFVLEPCICDLGFEFKCGEECFYIEKSVDELVKRGVF